MSSTNKTTNYQLSQFVGTDIPSILNDYNGDMRKIDNAIKDVSVAGGDNATEISELKSTVGAHTTEISGINSTVNSLSGRVVGIESKIPANASADNKLITAEDIPSIPSIDELEVKVDALDTTVDGLGTSVASLTSSVNTINSVIPSNASVSNKLATMADVEGGGSAELEARVEAIENVIPDDATATGVTRIPLLNDVPNMVDGHFTRVSKTSGSRDVKTELTLTASAPRQLATSVSTGTYLAKLEDIFTKASSFDVSLDFGGTEIAYLRVGLDDIGNFILHKSGSAFVGYKMTASNVYMLVGACASGSPKGLHLYTLSMGSTPTLSHTDYTNMSESGSIILYEYGV